MNAQLKDGVLVCLGAIVGGVLGMFGCEWLVSQGFYGLILPGALAGLGAGIFPNRSKLIAILCSIYGLVMGIITDWRIEPFIADKSFGYYISHLHQLRGLTMILIALGGLVAFWIPFRRIPPQKRNQPA